jgi:hypothetical protein
MCRELEGFSRKICSKNAMHVREIKGKHKHVKPVD